MKLCKSCGREYNKIIIEKKDCSVCYQRLYNLEKSRRLRKENPDLYKLKYVEWKKKYLQKNRKKVKEYQKEYQKKNRDKMKEYHRKYYMNVTIAKRKKLK